MAATGSEFALATRRPKGGHVCEQEGCWAFLGKGHALEPMQLVGETSEGDGEGDGPRCATCGKEAYFPLRAGGGFGWASKEDAELLRGGLSIAQPKLGFGVGRCE